MKNKRIVGMVVALVFLGLAGNSQGKIGYLSLNELMSAMPEYKKAETDMKDYQQALSDQSKEYQQELTAKDSIYKADSLNWNEATREVKRKELSDLYKKFLTFNQGVQQMLNQKEQELLAPIQQKAANTAQQVAKENGYSYILSKEQLIVAPPGDDLLSLALKKLNIQPPAKGGSK